MHSVSLLLGASTAAAAVLPRASQPCRYDRPADRLEEDEYIVHLKHGYSIERRFEHLGFDLKQANGGVFAAFRFINAYGLRVDNRTMHERIRFDPDVSFVEHSHHMDLHHDEEVLGVHGMQDHIRLEPDESPCQMWARGILRHVVRSLSTSELSNFGDHVDIVAPGENIMWACWIPGSTSTYKLTGTRQATPMVAAIMAIFVSNENLHKSGDVTTVQTRLSQNWLTGIVSGVFSKTLLIN